MDTKWCDLTHISRGRYFLKTRSIRKRGNLVRQRRPLDLSRRQVGIEARQTVDTWRTLLTIHTLCWLRTFIVANHSSVWVLLKHRFTIDHHLPLLSRFLVPWGGNLVNHGVMHRWLCTYYPCWPHHVNYRGNNGTVEHHTHILRTKVSLLPLTGVSSVSRLRSLWRLSCSTMVTFISFKALLTGDKNGRDDEGDGDVVQVRKTTTNF